MHKNNQFGEGANAFIRNDRGPHGGNVRDGGTSFPGDDTSWFYLWSREHAFRSAKTREFLCFSAKWSQVSSFEFCPLKNIPGSASDEQSGGQSYEGARTERNSRKENESGHG